MSYFYDINKITYDRLLQTTKYQKPYRNSGNAYPLGDRRYSARHFRALEDGTFEVWYMHRENSDKVIKGEEINDYYKNRKPLAKVYPDNTLEFVGGNGLHQGERGLLSELIGYGTIAQVKSKGGTIWTSVNGTYPVFEGLRISLDTRKAVTQFQVIQPTLNRKRSNEAMKKYKDFYNLYPMYVNATNDKALAELFIDLYNQLGEERFMRMDSREIRVMVDNKHYLDAAVSLYLLNSPWYRSSIRYFAQDDGSRSLRVPNNWQEAITYHVNKKFRKIILSLDESVFDWTPLPEGTLKASDWDHKIVVNGKECKQL